MTRVHEPPAFPPEAPPAAPARLAIGDWTADFATNELRRGDEVQRVEPRAMDVLRLLAERPGEVVAREALFAGAWPGVIVGDEALTQCIIKLRRALRDRPRAPTYIETIAKRGYRLIAAVGPASPTTPPTRSATSTPARRRPLVVAAVLVAALAVAAVAFLATRDDASPTAAGDGERVTLVVPPFEWLGGEAEHAYLARGLRDELMAELARIPQLRLIRAPAPEPATGVRDPGYVIAGSVQRQGATVRVTLSAIDRATREQLWSERFVRPFDDLFGLQDELVATVAQRLPARLDEATRLRRAQRYTHSLAAYDAFLRAQALLLVREPEANDEARALYRRAIALDPAFARAHAGLAMTHALDALLGRAPDRAATLARALELAEAAQRLDPTIPEIHWALAFVHAQAREHDAALQALARAVALNPSYADAYAFMGGIRTYIGEPAAAIPLLRTAFRLNPGGGHLYHLLLGRALLLGGDAEQARTHLREARSRNPVNLETLVWLAAAEMAVGDRAAAEWDAEELRALDPGFSLARWLGAYPMTSERQQHALADLLAPLGL